VSIDRAEHGSVLNSCGGNPVLQRSDGAVDGSATRAAWPKIAELAKTFHEPGHKIRVKDETGGIVILIGVATLHHSTKAVSTGVLQHSQQAR
jgi:hypothetical protein